MNGYFLEEVKAGRMRFDDFAVKTSYDWSRLAGKLYSRWRKKLPLAVEVDDLRQEMLLQGWVALQQYDASKGSMPIASYVVCRAWQTGLRYVHVQRNAKRRDDKAMSRHPIVVSQLALPDEAREAALSWFESVMAVCHDPLPDELVEVAEWVDRAIASARGIDVYALVAFRLSFGDIRQAGELLFQDLVLQRTQRWERSLDATRQVKKTLKVFSQFE